MAFRKIASCLILAASLACAAQFPVRVEHFPKDLNGTLTVDETGISYRGADQQSGSLSGADPRADPLVCAGPPGPAAPANHCSSHWDYRDIQRLTVSPTRITVLTYQDNRYLLGADRSYEFSGQIPAAELYGLLAPRLDQRFVVAVAEPLTAAWLSIPAKHLRPVTGTEGVLTFAADAIVYATGAKDDSRTWRYQDIQTISSSSPFELTVTTLEKSFHFQLKAPLPEARYNELWLKIEAKNGRVQ